MRSGSLQEWKDDGRYNSVVLFTSSPSSPPVIRTVVFVVVVVLKVVVVAGLVVVVVFGLYLLSSIVVHSILVEIRTTEPITTLIKSSDENSFEGFEQSRAPRKYPRTNFNADMIGF